MARFGLAGLGGLVVITACLAVAGCGGSTPPTATGPAAVTTPATMGVSSPAFAAGGRIPARYTCKGADISPPLRFTGVPSTAKALALLMIDLNAPGGSFTHWAVADIPPATRELKPGHLPLGAVAGRNGFGKVGYGGPCPPAGKRHNYVIDVVALRQRMKVTPGFASGALDRERPVGTGVLRGTFARG